MQFAPVLACWLLHRNPTSNRPILLCSRHPNRQPRPPIFNWATRALPVKRVSPENFCDTLPRRYQSLIGPLEFYDIPFPGLGQALRNLLPLARQSQHKYLRNKNP
jgi:hypothetical protein